MRKYYSIAEKRICIDFPYQFADCENWHKFEIGECEPHINVVCKVAEKLPGFDGEWAKGEKNAQNDQDNCHGSNLPVVIGNGL